MLIKCLLNNQKSCLLLPFTEEKRKKVKFLTFYSYKNIIVIQYLHWEFENHTDAFMYAM